MSDLRKLAQGFQTQEERTAWVRRWDWIGEQIGENGMSVEDMHDELMDILMQGDYEQFEHDMYRLFVAGNDAGVVELVSSLYNRGTFLN